MKIKFYSGLVLTGILCALCFAFRPIGMSGFAGATEDSLSMYSRFDFIPGEELIYVEDFAQDLLGELPQGWNTTGTAELKKRGNTHWLKLEQDAFFISSNAESFTENFTVEFDVLLDYTFENAFYPVFSFGLLSSESYPTNSNQVLSEYYMLPYTKVDWMVATEGYSLCRFGSFQGGAQYLNTGEQSLSTIENRLKKVIHVSMQGQKERLRIWMDEEKIYDLPRAIPTGVIFNQLFFEVGSSSYESDQLGIYVSNFHIAKGQNQLLRDLNEKGKWVCHAIQFHTGSSKLLPASYPILKQVSEVLTAHPDWNLTIIGHTDSDGNPELNQKLSEARSQEVSKALNTHFNISTKRMITKGLGSSEPLMPNTGAKEKAQNRRVEFIITKP